MRDALRLMCATACVVVPAFWDAHREPGDWRIMARWIDAELPHLEAEFFPTYRAFNISWHEKQKRRITSFAEPRGRFAAE